MQQAVVHMQTSVQPKKFGQHCRPWRRHYRSVRIRRSYNETRCSALRFRCYVVLPRVHRFDAEGKPRCKRQEQQVSTPKGNLVVNVKSNSLELGSFFKVQGTITNTTDWDFKYLRLTVRFYGPNGNEWAALCPTDGYSCETLGISVPAHRTT